MVKKQKGKVISVTPAKAKDGNLNMVKVEETSLAAVDRLDQLNAEVQRTRRKRDEEPRGNSRRACLIVFMYGIIH